MQKRVVTLGEMETTHGTNNMSSYSLRVIYIYLILNVQSASNRDVLSPQYDTIPQGEQLASSWKIIYYSPFNLERPNICATKKR